MINKKIAVIIPVYKPDKNLRKLLLRLWEQDCRINEILLINTEEKLFNHKLLENLDAGLYGLIRLINIEKKEFDHGGTRNYGVSLVNSDYVVFMTQDAMPKDRHLISALAKPFKDELVYVSYARQLPKKDCSITECYNREFNYPEYDIEKDLDTLSKYGIKNYFCSDVCSMYRVDKFNELGGFPDRIIFNEDMIFAHKAINDGGRVYYASGARVVHSHNYSCMEQLRRNFDNGVSQAMHPEVFKGIPSEGEGIRMVVSTIRRLAAEGHFMAIPGLIVNSAFKYVGFRLGKGYRSLSTNIIKRITSNKEFWNNMEEMKC